ncbi:hypothetical protein PsorP6_004928 [Peronosclerospora sorghi]|uniref:Uncharacterized protein n=1 Tax=Peronosclerospora sorghi TaxID=230839 RepID=A0ACC0W5U5_9STRA|nr:hypothetical protein PsorP6_004928 [Peronosclerospora sorghi]
MYSGPIPQQPPIIVAPRSSHFETNSIYCCTLRSVRIACGSLDSASAQLSGMTVNLLAYAPKRTRRLHKLVCKFSSACSSWRALQTASGCEQLNRIPRNSAFDMDSVKRINSCAASHTFSPLRSWPRLLSVNDTITSADFCVSPLAPCTPSSAILASSTDDNVSASSGGSEPQTFGFGLVVSDDVSVHSSHASRATRPAIVV